MDVTTVDYGDLLDAYLVAQAEMDEARQRVRRLEQIGREHRTALKAARERHDLLRRRYEAAGEACREHCRLTIPDWGNRGPIPR